LVQIKSEALLPRPPARAEGEEDPAEALARQLRIYKRFKEIADWLGQRDSQGFQTYIRLAPPPKIEIFHELDGVTLADLLEAGESIIRNVQPAEDIGSIITARKVTIRDRISRIISDLRQFGRSRFSSLLSQSTDRVELVVTFLAVLELVKRRRIIAEQDGLFAEIKILPSADQDYSRDPGLIEDLEFDDYG
ncbi:MAG TPA: segregation/condensation protein A, partial [Anaerolineales bacterium]|nr:segregation/condensation protein A [Anaerolineales bacterium]